MDGMAGKGNMQGKQDAGMTDMQPMMDMMDEMKGMMEEMQSSKDMGKMPEMMKKMADMQGMMAEMMSGGETVPPDEYDGLSPEGKDKADEAEVMGKMK